MEIRDYVAGDEQKILGLFEIVFKQKMSLEQWQWRFRDNPAGSHMIKLMWDGNTLAGHYAVSPVVFEVEGSDYLTAHVLTTMTHPEYNGRGIFKQLSTALYEDVVGKYQCHASWCFPNSNSHYGFIKNLGYSNLAVVHSLGLPASKIRSGSDVTAEEFVEFDDHKTDFISGHLERFPVKIKRSKKYLNWRYCLKPAVQYKKFLFFRDGATGMLVTKTYPSGNNRYDLNIVECHFDDYTMLHDSIAHVMKAYGLEFERVALWKNLFDSEHLQLENQGFVPVVPQAYLTAKLHSSMPPAFADYKNWYIAMGDSDVF